MSPTSGDCLKLKYVLSLVLALTAGQVRGAAPEQSVRKLASLAPLPSLTASLGISSEQIRFPELALTTNEMAARIGQLRRELKGGPSDADQYYEIARLLKLSRRGDEATVAFSNAAALYRPRAEARPEDGALQARFADVLQEIERREEAEHILRATITRLPKDWNCHAALGSLLDGRAMRAVLGTNAESSLSAIGTMSGIPDLHYAPKPSDIEEAEKCRVEAKRCFDRAVELAPKNPEAWMARALHRTVNGMFQQAIDRARGKPQARPTGLFDYMSGDETCADWEQVARLSPTNHVAIAYWGWSEALPAIMKVDEDKPVDTLASRRRKNLLESIRMLESLADSAAPKRTAAGACEAIGLLRASVFHDSPGAIAAFRRAVTLDPSRDSLWESLAGITAMNDNSSDLIMVCEQHLKHSDTARSHVMLAKAFDSAGQFDKALAQARLAVQRDRKDVTAHLSVAALLLRHAAEPDFGEPWKQPLDLAFHLIEAMEDSQSRSSLFVSWLLVRAVALGVNGDTEEARKAVRKAMEFNSADERARDRAKEIEMALGR